LAKRWISGFVGLLGITFCLWLLCGGANGYAARPHQQVGQRVIGPGMATVG